MPVVLKQDGYEKMLELPRVSQREFERFARTNPDIRIERSAEGERIVMPPADAFTDSRNANLIGVLVLWNLAQGEPGFTLPNGATRSPDAAWLAKGRWDALTEAQRKTFAPVVPDLVVEPMSPSDSLPVVPAKREEYRDNGARLGLLIDRKRRTVYLYRPGKPVEQALNPTVVSAEPEFPGLILPMDRIF